MNIQAEKLKIMKMILETDNTSILESIKSIFNKENSADFWTNLSDEHKEDILKGIEEVDNGQVVNYNDFMAKHRESERCYSQKEHLINWKNFLNTSNLNGLIRSRIIS
ncbi:hypothetical protein [Fulvivirga sp.]|uniref:hypothetical protein n=1 Tax=Fulvivirga sp. TaxID=1931237 RepID=UPI0032F02630